MRSGIFAHSASRLTTFGGIEGSANQDTLYIFAFVGRPRFVRTAIRHRSTPNIEEKSTRFSKALNLLLHESQTHPFASTTKSFPSECGTMCSSEMNFSFA